MWLLVPRFIVAMLHSLLVCLLEVSTTGGTLRAPKDDLAQEMTHDLEMNFNKIAPFGKEDTTKMLQDHAAKMQNTLVEAVENAEVAEIRVIRLFALCRRIRERKNVHETIVDLVYQLICC